MKLIIQRAGQWTTSCTQSSHANIGREGVGIADIKVENWPTSRTRAPSRLFCSALRLHRNGSDARCVGFRDTIHYSMQRPVAVFPEPYSRFAIAGRDGRHATVLTACVKRLAPASANDVARVGAATPQSSSSLKNADDPEGGRIGVCSQTFAKTLTWYYAKILRRLHRKRSVGRCASHSMTWVAVNAGIWCSERVPRWIPSRLGRSVEYASPMRIHSRNTEANV